MPLTYTANLTSIPEIAKPIGHNTAKITGIQAYIGYLPLDPIAA